METTTKNEAPLMDIYKACEIAEGFGSGEDATIEDMVNAWSSLIKTGQCWKLQGWYGRSAMSIIKGGTIDEHGNITDLGRSYIEEHGHEKAW